MVDLYLSKHFKRKELECACCGELILDNSFLDKLEKVRSIYGKPMLINSGYRCQLNNSIVGGEPHSAHLDGNAADISIIGSQERYELVRAAIMAGAEGIGVYPRWIHIDFKKREFGRCLWVGK